MNFIKRKLTDETATTALGRELSLFCRKGLTICLHGDLGAGKTTLARALIQALSDTGKIPDVPSPTFSLMQPYDELRIDVHHFDLYRIDQIDEIYELGLFDDMENRLTLIEWPDRLGSEIPPDRLDVYLEIEDSTRSAKISGLGETAPIVNRMATVAKFLTDSEWSNAQRCFLQGDASARRYERLTQADGGKAILMDMPKASDGPTIRDGKTYSQIAHIAEGIVPVAAINAKLLDMGFSAPRSLQQDLENGLMIIEDFGDNVFGTMFGNKQDIEQPMETATELLVEMTSMKWPDVVDDHKIARFDCPAFVMEAELLLDWFWPLQKTGQADGQVRQSFIDIWKQLFALIKTDQPVWVLRDFHSPNLIWMPERQGIKRVGLIDTQDCLLGHPAYDLVSILQDARIDLPRHFETKLHEHYLSLRQRRDENFDAPAFETAYAVFGAQRATKILGIFARLYMRDGKPGYLQHIPRVSAALEKNLRHPALGNLADWYKTNLPVPERQSGDLP